ncbi:MAG: hypothetical protein EBV19_07675, partial [Flavobacteriia bacterium]|nr:hypothetical protein [Flavobacteriia bacterium]
MWNKAILGCFLWISWGGFCQIETGSWRMHTATMRAIDIASDNATVFVAYENGLLRYHLESKEKTLLNKLNGLSDILLSSLFYDSVGQALYIGYKNGNIDQIIGDRIYNIPAIRLASFSGSKKINRFYRTEEGIYVCTDFGVVLLNPDKKEIKDTYYPTNGEEPIVDITLKNKTLFALSPTRLFTGMEADPLLPAPQGWTHDVRLQEWPYGVYAAIEKVNEDIFVLARSTEFGNDTVLKLIPTEFEVFQYYSTSLEIANLGQHNNLLDVLADGALLSLDAQGGLQESVLSFYLGIYFRPNQMVVLPDGNKWMADEF